MDNIKTPNYDYDYTEFEVKIWYNYYHLKWVMIEL